MKILVGLSGGVDSAVAAYLLKEQGHDVTCAFMRNWDSGLNNDILGNPTTNDPVCPQEADYQDAVKVAQKLDLALLRVDFIKEYWDEVFTVFLSEYEKGRTPNPDILCNKYIKFDHFRRFATDQGFDWLATGHYAKTEVIGDRTYLKKAADRNKDQSYFLAQVSYDAIAHTVFPLADLDKTEVRNIARKLDLNVADKKDSTGICFIGERDFRAFLQNYLPAKDGDIIDLKSGKVLGRHVGVLYYTIGQRKGLGLSGGPWFVCGKDVVNNILYVCSVEHEDLLYSDSCLITGFNNLYGNLPQVANAKFRYRQKDNPVMIETIDETTLKLSYPQKVKAVTEGQEAVLYDGDICLGGGTIEKTYRDNKALSERLKELAHE